tara:strand:- start:102 stop:1469 length:1368 start_codon:yes stop_codon:yes gene_type:complete
MIRALWTLVKISIIVAVVVWVAEHPGKIKIDWLEYNLEFQIGFFLVALLLLVVTGIVIFSIVKGVMDLPKNLVRYRDMTNKDKGFKALTIGLTAVAAGDAKAAAYQAHRARQFLSNDNPLPTLLEAQAARLKGDELEASRAFIALMDNKDSSFMGVRGLLQSALDHGDYVGALELGHRALSDYPKQGWILCIVYDLEIKARHWDSARKILYRTEKAGAITAGKAQSDRVAMLLAEAEEFKAAGQEEFFFRALNKAYKFDNKFLPTALRLGQMYIERGKHKAAISLIEKTWKRNPHPGLVALWAEAYQPPKDSDPMMRVRWFEKLLSFNPESVEGLLAVANILIQEGLWGEARKHLEKAETIRPNVHLYKIWARLEERATHDDAAVRVWLEKAADAPRERVWICSETGRIYDEWTPISDQGLFNTIIWDFPQGRSVNQTLLATPYHMTAPLLEVAK